MLNNLLILCHANHFHIRTLAAIYNVFGCELISSRDHSSAKLHQRNNDQPRLHTLLHHHHNHVSPSDSAGSKHIGALIGKALYISKTIAGDDVAFIYMDQRLLSRAQTRIFIYNVITEIKIFRNIYFIILLKICIGIKFYARQKFGQKIH